MSQQILKGINIKHYTDT